AHALDVGEGGQGGEGAPLGVGEEDGRGVAGDQLRGRLEHEVNRLFQLERRGEEPPHLTEQVDYYLVIHPTGEYTGRSAEFRQERTVGRLRPCPDRQKSALTGLELRDDLGHHLDAVAADAAVRELEDRPLRV